MQQKLHLDDGTREKLRYLSMYHDGNMSKAAIEAIETAYEIKQAQAEIKTGILNIEDHPDYKALLRYQETVLKR